MNHFSVILVGENSETGIHSASWNVRFKFCLIFYHNANNCHYTVVFVLTYYWVGVKL